MKYSFSLILAGLALTSVSSFGAVIDLSNLGGTFPSYTDNSGIIGLKIEYTTGQAVGTTENRGYSPQTGGMSLPSANFPDGHLAVGPGDKVVLDFSNVVGNHMITVGFIDLDNNAFGGNEGASITSLAGTQRVEGSPVQILNSQAHLAGNITNVANLSPDANGKITIQADTSVEQGAAGNGFFAIQVSTAGPVIPEPSTTLLGLLGLSFVAFRRRRRA